MYLLTYLLTIYEKCAVHALLQENIYHFLEVVNILFTDITSTYIGIITGFKF